MTIRKVQAVLRGALLQTSAFTLFLFFASPWVTALDRIVQMEVKQDITGFIVDSQTDHVMAMTSANEIVVINEKGQVEISQKLPHKLDSAIYIPKLKALGRLDIFLTTVSAPL